MSTVKQLEKKLADAKKKELKERWEVYLNRVKSFLDKMIGRTVISHYSNGGFILYKIIGYEEQYYGYREGFNGSWSPCRWIEVTTSAYIHCRVADNRGNWFRGMIEHEGLQFKAKVVRGKDKSNLEFSKIELNDNTLSKEVLSTISKISKIGYTEYKEYREDPNYSRAMDSFLTFTQEAPEGMWEAAKQIADDNLKKTMEFWKVFEPKCQNLKPLYETTKW